MQARGSTRGEPWFGRRRYGYGAGWPRNWKGWALWATMLAIIADLPYALHSFFTLPRLSLAVIATIALVTPALYVDCERPH